jgi:hypothetical protein
MKSWIKRESGWFLVGFVLPVVLLIGSELAFSKSPLPFWRRILTLEDTCAYWSCFIIPAFIFVCVLFVRGFWNAWLRFKEYRETKNR